MASGTIVSQTRTLDDLFPVGDVTVSYYEQGSEGKMHLLAVRRSDASGNTAPVTLQTPSREESLQAGNPTPYRIISIMADRPGYARVIVDGVQVFDGIVTNQNLLMIPLPAPIAGVSPGQTYETSDQNL